jgi:ABC-type lipoprotein release transport system permease subunit
MIDWEIGAGQYWHKDYDPFDQFTLENAHAPVPAELIPEIESAGAVPILISSGTIYPSGRMQPVLIKGIPPGQSLLSLPTNRLDTLVDAIPAIIGSNMAFASKLSVGDMVVLRWRDSRGTFDAAQIYITRVFQTNVPTVDAGQVWLPLDTLQSMLAMPGEITLLSFRSHPPPDESGTWKVMPVKSLVADIESMIRTKSASQSIFYGILLLLALLAVFDTQILSIFRRQKEIGTYIALGYTRKEVAGLFTIEGAMHAVLAIIVGTLYGLPFFIWQSHEGWKLPVNSADYGFSIASVLYPVYSAGLILSTMLLIFITTLIVSYLPSRRIAKMNPTEALRGKLQ